MYVFAGLCQSIPELEKRYQEASDKKTKMELALELADGLVERDVKKAADYAQKGYSLAVEQKDKAGAATALSIGGECDYLNRNYKQAEDRFIRSVKFAKEAGATSLVISSYRNLSKIALKGRNGYKMAYDYTQDALDYLSSKGGITTNQDVERRIRGMRSKLLNDKEELEKEKKQLEKDIAALKYERDKLSNDKTHLTIQQERLSKEKDNYQKVASEKESAYEQLTREQREMENKSSKKISTLEKESSLKSKRISQQDREISNKDEVIEQTALSLEKSKNLRNVLAMLSGFVVVLALLFYARYAAKKRANRNLEEKNSIIEEERKRSDGLLLNILPPSIATELKETGSAKARRYDEATVLFTDFKNFSKISEELTPEALVSELDKCFKGFDFIISQYGIEKIKTIGDAYMCAAGLSERTSSPEKVVKAALEMQRFLEDIRREKELNNEPYFEARIGIHTGPVVAGVVGSNKFAYDIWGDTVNIAARMEQNCEANKINISETTYWKIKYNFDCTYRGRIPAKNKGEIDMYYVNYEM